MPEDAKPNLFTRVVKKINRENLAKHKSFLLTQFINLETKKVIPEDCNLLSKMKESLERAKKINQESESEHSKSKTA